MKPDTPALSKDRPRLFCASLADVFDNRVPLTWRGDLFELIRKCWRPQNTFKMLPADWGTGYQNVSLGVTAENQQYCDQRWRIIAKH